MKKLNPCALYSLLTQRATPIHTYINDTLCDYLTNQMFAFSKKKTNQMFEELPTLLFLFNC